MRRRRRVLPEKNAGGERKSPRRIRSILAELQENEAFFSIDEFGSFAIRAQGGRALVGPGEIPTVPQHQKIEG